MSHIQDPLRSFFSFRSPFCLLSPKGSYLSPKLLDLLNGFEETLCSRLKNLKPVVDEDILSLSWMRRAMETLSATHADIKALITALELPIYDWDENWIGFYLDDTIRLLDIGIAFISEISRLKQGHLFLQCILHGLKTASHQNHATILSALNDWRQRISGTNPSPRLESCYAAMNTLSPMLELPKVKKSSKGEVLMRAMHAVRVVTLFIARVFACAFSGSDKDLIDLHVSETYLWVEAFNDLQVRVNKEIRNKISGRKFTFLREMEDIDKAMMSLSEGVELAGVKEKQNLEKLLAKSSGGLDLLKKDVDNFFQVILTGRDALLCNLRVGDDETSDEMLRGRGRGR